MPPSILVGVTAKESLRLLGDFPAELASRGWDVHIVADGFDEAVAPALNLHRLRMKRNPSPISDGLALLKWCALLAYLRLDVIAVATPKASLLGLIAGSILRVRRRVYFLWGLRFESLTGPKRLLFLALEKLTGALATEIVSVSPSLSEAHNGFFPNQSRKVRVIGHGASKGVDLAKFVPLSPQEKRKAKKSLGIPIASELPVLGYVGRIHPDKGLLILAEALASLSEREIGFHLVTVGTIEDDGQILQALSECTAFHTHFDFSRNPEVFFQVMDIFCLPTLREGLPNVCLEALACGVPVVTTNVTGASDSVAHEFNGLVVDEVSASALGAALEKIVRDVALRAKFSQNARVWVSERFSQDKVAKEIAGYFASLTDSVDYRLAPPERNRADRDRYKEFEMRTKP